MEFTNGVCLDILMINLGDSLSKESQATFAHHASKWFFNVLDYKKSEKEVKEHQCFF